MQKQVKMLNFFLLCFYKH